MFTPINKFDAGIHPKLFIASLAIVPFYCMPFVMNDLSERSELSVIAVASVPSIMMLSQLLFLVLFPMLMAQGCLVSVRRIIRVSGFSLLFILLGIENYYILLVGAIFMGVGGGAIFYWGTNIALSSGAPVNAFTFRLGCSLLITGIFTFFSSYIFSSISIYILLFLVSLTYIIVSFSKYYLDSDLFGLEVGSQKHTSNLSFVSILPMVFVFLFFLGQTGFYSHHVFLAGGSELQVGALSMSRVTAGLFLLGFGAKLWTLRNSLNLTYLMIIQVLIVYTMIYAKNAWIIYVSVAFYEVILNILAADLQASAGSKFQSLALKFMPFSIILGASIGPLVFAFLLLQFGVQASLFIPLFSLFIPALLKVEQWKRPESARE